jgi:hypothetical protein
MGRLKRIWDGNVKQGTEVAYRGQLPQRLFSGEFLKYGNEPCGSMKGWIYLNQSSDCQLLKKDSVSWS